MRLTCIPSNSITGPSTTAQRSVFKKCKIVRSPTEDTPQTGCHRSVLGDESSKSFYLTGSKKQAYKFLLHS